MNAFTRYGLRGVMIAKFFPGISTVVPPMAGMSKVKTSRFFFFDGIGALLYAGSFLLLGYGFSSQIEQIGAAISHVGASALSLLAVIAAFYLAYKFWQRQRLVRELRTTRITVAELRTRLDAGEKPLILDLRSSAELERDPSIMCGALHLGLEDLESRRNELPHDRDIIVYCSCPNEVTSARFALRLHRKGFTRVRPLLGGIEAWRKESFPIETWQKDLPESIVSNSGKPGAVVGTQTNSLSA